MQLALIVEDDSELAQALKSSLTKEGLKVDLAKNLRIASILVAQYQYNLVILDRVLPDGDGIDLVERILEINYQARILVLSTESSVNQRIRGFRLGVDEYLSKPFSSQELRLRVRNLLSRQKIELSEAIYCNGIMLFPKTCSLVVDGSWSKIRSKESQILACLIYHQNFVVTDELLLDFVWGYTGRVPSHRSISVYIRRIRTYLGKRSGQLKTVRGVGYCLS
ncbi:MAG: response regulator transcription factor [Candidatus Pacebacteria bacterium]|jgi:DNA-binding response OmpR family regulator|nr:response regulator transcription factor [Candidatus Paceibacterota bacterium]MBT3512343.1 response regulator transcription factor [Candidatus Paceibacterota bacterium]MBT4005033.1 response regulator transcription factor [Candidatus Paceibacterota bacterium]MBT4358808.1 response regulator transcription factor [Candidatus Paceibacterota bacterium]MBT4680443.1 response regulator transcription factor [Candidatus Paceibacterota bacterium]